MATQPATGITTLASVPQAGGQAGGATSTAGVDNAGDVVFVSDATNLAGTDANGASDVFLRTAAGQTLLISRTAADASGDGASDSPVISASGRFIAFRTDATNVITTGTDTGGHGDVVLYDRDPINTGLDTAHTITLVSVNTGGSVPANGDSDEPALAVHNNVPTVAFRSAATNLVTGVTDANAATDVFVRTGSTTSMVSVQPNGDPAGDDSADPAVAVTGSAAYVAFDSLASDITAGDSDGVRDVFLRTIPTSGAASSAFVSRQGTTVPDGSSSHPSISSDGKTITFSSDSKNFWSGDNNNLTDVFYYTTHGLGVISTAPHGDYAPYAPNGASDQPQVSGNGRYIVYRSAADNIAGHDTNTDKDVFLVDIITGFRSRLSLSSTDAQATGGDTGTPHISSDGHFVAFTSAATNLSASDADPQVDAFLRTRDIVKPGAATATADSAHPLPSTKAAGAHVTMTLSATDGTGDVASGITGYRWEWNETSKSSLDTLYTQVLPGASTAKETLWANGKWWFHVRAVDRAGNFGPTKTFGPFLITTDRPKLTVTWPKTGYRLAGNVHVSWSATDTKNPVTSYSVRWTRQAFDQTTTTSKTVKSHITATHATVSLAAGYNYWLQVTAYNGLGNDTTKRAAAITTPAAVTHFKLPSSWTKKTNNAFYQHTAYAADKNGAVLKIDHPAGFFKEVVLVVTACPTCGAIFVGNSYLSLSSTKTKHQIMVAFPQASSMLPKGSFLVTAQRSKKAPTVEIEGAVWTAG